MRWLAWLGAALAACGHGSGTRTGDGLGAALEPAAHGQFADEDRYTPSYGKAELERALSAERAAAASTERRIAELSRDPRPDDQLRVALADLAVRRRFIAALEACDATGRTCPPRLDDPPWSYPIDPPGEPELDAHSRFDLASWQVVAAELHGRACACRTLACVDSMGVAIDELETRPMPEVQADEEASLAITRARACLFRLRGKKVGRRSPAQG
jgi:hypothetical protein